MSIRFAGSSSVHERRRRRLAQECDVATVAAAGTGPHSRSGAEPRGLSSAELFETSALHSLIRPQLWVHWCVVALCLACWAGLLYVGDLVEQTDLGIKSILGIRSGRLANFFSTIMLLWAGQLALLIYWYRRKSRNDFHGRYRQWIWIGVTLQFFLAVVATEAHRPFGAYMEQMWPLDVPQYALLSWLVPTSTIGLAMFRLLGLEMRGCSSSRTLLWIAGISGLTAALSLVIGGLLPLRACDLLQVGSATLAHLGLATALLFHARHVIHVTNEPPAMKRGASVLSRIFSAAAAQSRSIRLRLRELRGRRLLQSGKTASPAPATSASKSAASKSAASKQSAGPTESTAIKPHVAQSTVSRTANGDHTATAGAPEPVPAAEPRRRIDSAESLKGPRRPPTRPVDLRDEEDDHVRSEDDGRRALSRKERRRLRKNEEQARRHASSAR